MPPNLSLGLLTKSNHIIVFHMPSLYQKKLMKIEKFLQNIFSLPLVLAG